MPGVLKLVLVSGLIDPTQVLACATFAPQLAIGNAFINRFRLAPRTIRARISMGFSPTGLFADMNRDHLVRVGVMGLIGRFRALDRIQYSRGRRVVLRTRRGIELGEVLAESAAPAADQEVDGEILRPISIEDELLEERIERDRQDACDACAAFLQEQDCTAVLLDVEHLFDGSGLYFYFLGDVPTEVDEFTAQLAATYDATVRFRQFADTLLQGCGPDCGTEGAEGSCDHCTSCAVAEACQTKRAPISTREP